MHKRHKISCVAPGPHGKRERDIQRVIGGVADGQADVQGDVVQAHLCGRRRCELGLQECEAFPGLVRRKQLPAHLQP